MWVSKGQSLGCGPGPGAKGPRPGSPEPRVRRPEAQVRGTVSGAWAWDPWPGAWPGAEGPRARGLARGTRAWGLLREGVQGRRNVPATRGGFKTNQECT